MVSGNEWESMSEYSIDLIPHTHTHTHTLINRTGVCQCVCVTLLLRETSTSMIASALRGWPSSMKTHLKTSRTMTVINWSPLTLW